MFIVTEYAALTYKQVIIDSGQKILLMFPRNQDVYTLLMAYIVR